MNRKHRSSCLLLVSVFTLSVAGIPLPTINREALRLFNSDTPVAFQFEKSTSDHELPSTQDFTTKSSRKSTSDMWERSRERTSDLGQVRDLLHQTPVNPGFASKLDLCSEFTKPDSLVLWLRSTPKSYRSPPV